MRPPLIILDTNVLYGTTERELIFEFAAHGLWRCGWSGEVAAELSRLGIMLEGFAPLPDGGHETVVVGLPDPNDEHVLQCARTHGASMILTYNLKDFPQSLMGGIQLLTPDQAILRMLQEDSTRSIAAVRSHWKKCAEQPDWPSYTAPASIVHACTKPAGV
jgi:hypothetical protein